MTVRSWPSQTASDMMHMVIERHALGSPLSQRGTVEYDGQQPTRTRIGRGKTLYRLADDGMLVQRQDGRYMRSLPTPAGVAAFRVPLPDDRRAYSLLRASGREGVTRQETADLGRALRRLWRQHYVLGVSALRELEPLGLALQGKYSRALWDARDSALTELALDWVGGLPASLVREKLR